MYFSRKIAARAPLGISKVKDLGLARDPRQNQLLAAMPDPEWARWLPQLEPIEMPLGKVLYESGTKLNHVYFPTTAIVSLLYVMEDGASAEIAVVGYEGIVGISLFMGGETTPSRAVVQSAGLGFRLKADLMLQEFNRAGPVLHLLLRYTQALITQMAQTAVCNRHHSLDQQLCRWLLLSLDRLSSNELVMTQELIANMLGVRREGVSEAAGRLHKAGLIAISVVTLPCLTAASLSNVPVNVMRSSRKNMTGFYRRSSRLKRRDSASEQCVDQDPTPAVHSRAAHEPAQDPLNQERAAYFEDQRR